MPEMKLPKRGDTVFVKDGNSWLGGIMNAIVSHGDEMLIGVKGHSHGASAVAVASKDYLKSWCYPGDVAKTSLKSERYHG